MSNIDEYMREVIRSGDASMDGLIRIAGTEEGRHFLAKEMELAEFIADQIRTVLSTQSANKSAPK